MINKFKHSPNNSAFKPYKKPYLKVLLNSKCVKDTFSPKGKVICVCSECFQLPTKMKILCINGELKIVN